MARLREEDGSVTVFVIGLTLALLMVAGLVHDGGRVLAARRQAHDLADNAARAGAQAVDIEVLRAGGTVSIDPIEARAAADDYLATTGLTGDVTVTADRVEVVVSITTPMVLLQLVGIAQRTVTAHGEARIVRGITGPES